MQIRWPSRPTSSISSSPRGMVPAADRTCASRHDLLDRQAAHRRRRRVRPRHAAVRRLYRPRPGRGRRGPRPSPAWRSRRRSAPTCRAASTRSRPPTLGSVSPGAPIYYRGIDIGQVLAYQLTADARGARHQDLRPGAVPRPGAHAPAGSGTPAASTSRPAPRASTSRSASLQALLVGGIEFDTPLGTSHRRDGRGRDEVPAVSRTSVRSAQAQFTEKIPFLVYFDGSVRGLNPGAPVEFRGIKVGTVTSVRLEFDPRRPTHPDPGDDRDRAAAAGRRPIGPGRARPEQRRPWPTSCKRGLRAQLQTGNLLTGELFVDLIFLPDAPPAELDTQRADPDHPLGAGDPGGAAGVGDRDPEQDRGAADRAARRQPEQDGGGRRDHRQLARAARRAASRRAGPEAAASRPSAGSTPTRVRCSRSLKATSETAAAALRQAQATLASIQRTIGPDSALTDGADNLMQELTRAARSIRVFADYLDRHPEALIRGKTGGGGQ